MSETTIPAPSAAPAAKAKYQPEEGAEGYVHVSVTEKQGRTLDTPVIEHYYPNQYEAISKLTGFKGGIVHDPRPKAAKK